MSNDIQVGKIVRFHQVPIGAKFQRDDRGSVYTKTSRSYASDGSGYVRINSQALCVLFTGTLEENWQELDRHTFTFTNKQRDDLVGEIVARAQRQYGADRIDADRLTRGLLCAHRAKPIRLIDLLNTCNVDFPDEILYGVYRHYDPRTDSLRGGWTAQHSEPHVPSIWDILAGRA